MISAIPKWPRTAALALTVFAGGLTACSDLLEVSDPGRFIDEDLDNPLAWNAVANGVEGRLQQPYSGFVIFTALLGDEYMHTGTWSQYQTVADGSFAEDGESAQYTSWIAARTEAQKAAERFQRLMGADAQRSALMGRVRAVEGWSNLLIGMQSCELVLVPFGPAVPYIEAYRAAVTTLTEAITILQAAGGGAQKHLDFARAGRARAHLFLGNLDQALADARAVSDNFVYEAIYTEQGASNSVVTLTTFVENKAAGMRAFWWPMVDTTGPSDVFRDPYTNQVDRRVEIVARHTNRRGVDGRSRHFSQFKYKTRTDDIRMASKAEMRLIEAEVAMRRGDLAGAMAILNAGRARVGLGPVANPGTASGVRDILLHERFATLFMEGHRHNDLYRFDLIRTRLGPDRATKFALPSSETNLNQNVSRPRTCPKRS